MKENGGKTVLEVLHGRFPALRARDFRLLWIGQAVSMTGTQMQGAAILWHVYQLTKSPLALGLVGLFRLVPIVLFSLFGGTVADALDRRRVMLVTQTAMALGATALWLLTATGRISVVGIYLLTALNAAVMAFGNPARQALIPNLVPREHFPNAAALNSLAMQVAGIVGPTLAGLLIAQGLLAATYGINALSFGAVILALLAIRSPAAENGEHARGEVSLAALREGLRFVWQTPILVWTILLDFFATFFSSANALLPIFATDILHVGARGYGLLSAAPAVGSLAAGAVMALRPTIRCQGLTVLWAVVAYGLSTVLFGFSTLFPLSWIALAGIGASDTVSTILRQTIRQLVSPDHLRGRMTAVNMIFFMGGPQLGEIEAGLAARWLGAQWSVITGGIGCLLAVAWVAARATTLRQYRDGEGEP